MYAWLPFNDAPDLFDHESALTNDGETAELFSQNYSELLSHVIDTV